jgi:hypothetical protein
VWPGPPYRYPIQSPRRNLGPINPAMTGLKPGQPALVRAAVTATVV